MDTLLIILLCILLLLIFLLLIIVSVLAYKLLINSKEKANSEPSELLAKAKEIISESPLKIKIHIEVFPTIEIDKKYKKIKLEKTKISVTAAEVKGALSEIENKFTKFEEAKTKATKTKM